MLVPAVIVAGAGLVTERAGGTTLITTTPLGGLEPLMARAGAVALKEPPPPPGAALHDGGGVGDVGAGGNRRRAGLGDREVGGNHRNHDHPVGGIGAADGEARGCGAEGAAATAGVRTWEWSCAAAAAVVAAAAASAIDVTCATAPEAAWLAGPTRSPRGALRQRFSALRGAELSVTSVGEQAAAPGSRLEHPTSPAAAAIPTGAGGAARVADTSSLTAR